MKCLECNTELIKGKTTKEEDGTEYTEFRCPRCRERFTDIKIPKNILFGEDYRVGD